MLLWIGALLFGDQPRRAHRRHIRQRYGYAGLDWLARFVAHLIFLRAFNGLNVRARRPGRVRNHAPAGFIRRTAPRNLPRSVRGSALRRALRHRDPRQRLAILLDALTRIDAFAAKLAPRLKRRFSRLFAICIARPPQVRVRQLALKAAFAADSS